MRRKPRKVTLARREILFVAAGMLAAGLAGGAARAIGTERILVDQLSGLAIYGFDPVSYFIDGGPRPGRAEFELVWSGVTWRFRSEGNRAAFERDPDVYAPAFGGYDAESVPEGHAVESDPHIFAIISNRLYLFRNAEARENFQSRNMLAAAEAAWPALKATLIP